MSNANITHLNLTGLQRFQYWQGQTLRSQDFRDQTAITAHLRQWHDRSLHTVYGISDGFEAFEEEKSGENFIRVSPGIGYDSFGQILLLLDEQLIPFPIREEQSIFLLVRYSNQRPEFFWKPTNQFKVRDGIPIAWLRHSTDNAENPEANVYQLRTDYAPPIARPIARPRIASGATLPGRTPWQIWQEREKLLGVQIEIDTSVAGFITVPCYFATLQGSLWNQQTGEFLPSPLGHITASTSTDFVFRLWVPQALIEDNSQQAFNHFLNFARQQQLFISWLGIQPDLPKQSQEEDHGTH